MGSVCSKVCQRAKKPLGVNGAARGGWPQKCLLADMSAPRFVERDLWNMRRERIGLTTA